jgi:acetate kinase
MADYALVLNAGSSSLKFSVYERLDDQEWQLSSRGQIEGSRILHRKLLGRISDFKMESQTTMHYVIDLDPAARIVRVTVDGVLTDELLV